MGVAGVGKSPTLAEARQIAGAADDASGTNAPIGFVDSDGRWHYRVTLTAAAAWRAAGAIEAASPVGGQSRTLEKVD